MKRHLSEREAESAGWPWLWSSHISQPGSQRYAGIQRISFYGRMTQWSHDAGASGCFQTFWIGLDPFISFSLTSLNFIFTERLPLKSAKGGLRIHVSILRLSEQKYFKKRVILGFKLLAYFHIVSLLVKEKLVFCFHFMRKLNRKTMIQGPKISWHFATQTSRAMESNGSILVKKIFSLFSENTSFSGFLVGVIFA